jgi:hypothetical protein
MRKPKYLRTLFQLFQLFILLGISSTALPQNLNQECGRVPVEPMLVDGATVSLNQLTANGQEVKAFIAVADAYLNCNKVFRESAAYAEFGSGKQQKTIVAAQAFLETRINIVKNFNEQVQAYKDAHPES